MAGGFANRATIASSLLLGACNLLTGAGDLVTRDAPESEAPDAGHTLPVGTETPFDAATADAPSVVVGADAADGADGADGGVTLPPGGRFVFVTSTRSKGNLSGIAGADAKCASLAHAAGLGGTWVAWLSSSENGGIDANDRIMSSEGWYLVTGKLVASSRGLLLADSLEHGIDRDENGNFVQSQPVWTGTRRGILAGPTCNGWRASSATFGTIGRTNAIGTEWTAEDVEDCASELRLYCFEN
jgi:hypothetical protein